MGKFLKWVAFNGSAVLAGLLAAAMIWFIRDWWTHYGPWAS
ncbi:hypothetical protein [Stenotrophomonas acidaminiphila]|nr:hypothetical protein [Stenotrophomonas acidaminiphila]